MKQPYYRRLLGVLLLLGTLGALFGLLKPGDGASLYRTVYPLVAVRDDALTTTLSFFNPSDTAANLTLTLGSSAASFTIPSKGTLNLSDADFPQAAPGQYAALANADQPLVGKAMVYTYPESLVGVYRGMPVGTGGSTAAFRLHFGPVSADSVLKLYNPGVSQAMIQAAVFGPDGQQGCVVNQEAGVDQPVEVSFKSCSTPVSPGSRVDVASSMPLVGLLNNLGSFRLNYEIERASIFEPLNAAEPSGMVYRFSIAHTSGEVPLEYSTYKEYYLASNLGSAQASLVRELYQADGTLLHQQASSLAQNGTQIFSLEDAAWSGANGPREAAMSVAASQPLAYNTNKMISVQTPVPNYSFASYASGSTSTAGVVYLPGLARDDHARSVVTVLNQSANSSATVSFKLYNADGSPAAQDTFDLAPLRWKQYDLAAYPSLMYPFYGSASVTGTQPVSVEVDMVNKANVPTCAPQITLSNNAQDPASPFTPITFKAAVTGPEPAVLWWELDGVPLPGITPPIFTVDYIKVVGEGEHTLSVTAYTSCGQSTASNTVRVGCIPPRVTLEQSPAGVFYAGDTVHFHALVDGSEPLTFAWTVDGAPLAQHSTDLERVFSEGNHTVSFSAENLCGEFGSSAADTRSFTVLKAPLPAPDLSLSTLEAGTSGIQSEDEVQYTAILRNAGKQVAPNSLFTNTLPDLLAYIPGSALATDGSAVSYDDAGHTLTWAGDIAPGIPVILTYKVKVVGGLPAGESLLNTAQVADGKGTVTPLSAAIQFQKGYRLFINNGALATASLTVDLTFTADMLNDGVTEFQVSNDAAFSPAGSATGWLPLNSSPQAFPGWQLDPYGDPRLPRSVYVRFRAPGGLEAGPFKASILYDVQPPAAPNLSSALPGAALPVSGARLGAAAGRWTVSASDDNSGAASVLVRGADGGPEMEFPITGPVTTFQWDPAGASVITVRAKDRSGNIGPSAQYYITRFVYLPLLNR